MLTTLCSHFISNNNTISSTDSVIVVTGARVDVDQGSVRRSIVAPHHCRPKVARRSNGMPKRILNSCKLLRSIPFDRRATLGRQWCGATIDLLILPCEEFDISN